MTVPDAIQVTREWITIRVKLRSSTPLRPIRLISMIVIKHGMTIDLMSYNKSEKERQVLLSL